MAKASTGMNQAEYERRLKAARRAGFSTCIIRQHPDGMIETIASDSEAETNPLAENSMDRLMKGKAN